MSIELAEEPAVVALEKPYFLIFIGDSQTKWMVKNTIGNLLDNVAKVFGMD